MGFIAAHPKGSSSPLCRGRKSGAGDRHWVGGRSSSAHSGKVWELYRRRMGKNAVLLHCEHRYG